MAMLEFTEISPRKKCVISKTNMITFTSSVRITITNESISKTKHLKAIFERKEKITNKNV